MHELASKILFDASVRLLDAELCSLRGWELHTAEYPIVDMAFTAKSRRTLRLLVRANEWNAQPPSLAFLAADATPLLAPPASPGGQFNPNPHPQTGRPFVCMRGSREYHTHGSHLGDLWENSKALPEFTLGSIITQVWNVWLKATP